jgi:hypothetical protein
MSPSTGVANGVVTEIRFLRRNGSSKSVQGGYGEWVLLQQPHARHPSPIPEGLLSRYRLARGAFVSCCRSFVFVSFAWLRWCAYAPARLADSASWISCFATTHWSVVTLDPGKKNRWTFFYSLTRRSKVRVLPTRARNNGTWDRRRIVSNMR